MAFKNSQVFKHLSKEKVKSLTKKCTTKRYIQGEVILEKGNQLKSVYVCLDGEMCYGDKSRNYQVYQPGVLFHDSFFAPLENLKNPLAQDLFANKESFVSSFRIGSLL